MFRLVAFLSVVGALLADAYALHLVARRRSFTKGSSMKALALVPIFLAGAGAAHAGPELGLALGSSTSVGAVGDGMRAGDIIGTAAQLELTAGARVMPNLAISFYTAAQGQHGAYSGTAGVIADLHIRPQTDVDPFVGIGGGLAAMLVDTAGDGVALSVGVELARLQVGVDFRVSKDFTLAPVLAAGASLYGARRAAGQDFVELRDKGLDWTFSAGLAGRFTR